ncbi:MAG: dihydrofolate reductase family protein [Actinobacteria bacterium]|nr:dihydrofolate reductase family protein [Actinomycetota bacterium]
MPVLRRRIPSGDPLGSSELLEWLGTDLGVRANMVASVDGRATVNGRVGHLTGPADQLLLVALRAWCDVLLVGAGTVRAEGYGAIDLPEELQELRVQRGQAPRPVLAVLIGRHDLDPALPVFSETGPDTRPWLISAAGSDTSRPDRNAHILEVSAGEDGRPSVREALQTLRGAGLGRVLSEGGPTILGHLLGQGLVNELFLTVSPQVVGGDGLRIVHVPEYQNPVELTLSDVLGGAHEVFLRYAAGTRPV